MDTPFLIKKENGIELAVFFQPHSGRQACCGVWNNAELKIAGRKAPENGQANEELLTFLADMLKIPTRALFLIRGHKSRHKVVSITGNADELEQKVVSWLNL